MVRHDERVDEVWRAFEPTVQLVAVRDSTFYTWRFIDAPAPPLQIREATASCSALEVR